MMKDAFPNINIIGNEVKPKYYESFDVYIRGVQHKLPEDVGTVYLFKKSENLFNFLKYFTTRMLVPYDNLCFIISEFLSGSMELGDF